MGRKHHKENLMRPRFRPALPLAIVAVLSVQTLPVRGADDEPPVPKEVSDLAGNYKGAWTMYGIDEKGEVVKRMAWTDTVKAEMPQVKDRRAYVTITDEMTFEGGKIPPFKMESKEGCILKRDGTPGDGFVEAAGQTHLMVKLDDGVWTYTSPAAAQELGRMGFPKDASGKHVLVKVVTKEDGVETHRISRVTTVTWKDKEGKERALQFISLKGHHKRQP